jgi:hypothetical protein
MSEIDEILDYLEYISQQKRSVSLVNTYHGVSISLGVNVREIVRRRKEVVFVAPSGQHISLLPSTEVLIHSDLFPMPIQARVASVDVHHRTATLRGLSYYQSTQESRKETRVQPKFDLNASVTFDSQEWAGIIADISTGGISLILKSQAIDLTQIFLPNTNVRILFSLAVSDREDAVKFSISAKVSYIQAINTMGEFRAGFMTYPLEDQKTVLRRYIFDRQTEMFGDVGKDSLSGYGRSIVT